MEKRKTSKKERQIEHYKHDGKQRLNNPPVGLVTPETDKDGGQKTYAYDPHIDPQLNWAGKAEHTSFEVPTVSLHVHERIDPRSIIEAVKKQEEAEPQLSLFGSPEENPPIREAIEFYKHKHNWTNRLIAGDSLLVINSLLEKEGLGGQVQMVYIDPPYGIKYGSNFQPFIDKRDVKDGKDEDLSHEPEMIRAFRDTWELGIHSYLNYLRDRLLLTRELLHESGSCFVQIGAENLHLVRALLDEVFGSENFVTIINFKSKSPLGQKGLADIYDYLVWYSKNKEKIKFRPLFKEQDISSDKEFRFFDDETSKNGYRKLSESEFSELSKADYKKIFRRSDLTSSGFTPTCQFDFEYEGRLRKAFGNKSWRTTRAGINTLIAARRIFILGKSPYFKQYYMDFPFSQLENSWHDTAYAGSKTYVVQTAPKVILRCLLMTTDPGDLVFDPTCGSGTTAYVAEQWGRRWITCDTSRVSVTLAKQLLMTAVFDFYKLAHPAEGVGSGFVYDTVPHISLKSIANNPEIREGMTSSEIVDAIHKYAAHETLFDHPSKDNSKTRVAGPFTVEAVPAPTVMPLDEINDGAEYNPDVSLARSGETQRQADWRDELLKTGIKGKGGQKIKFSRVETVAGTRWIHAVAETQEDMPQHTVISFGPEHAPMEQRQVTLAIEEAQQLVPRPKIIIFAAFQFDPEAAKDIDETNWPGVTLLKTQMNADLLTEDLKKKRASNESFWLIGQPDVEIAQIRKGSDEGKYRVAVQGFDYYNTKRFFDK